ncbi:hypothetical protein D3C59_29150 [Streptomyces sp. SHP22-7]|nr:hypothetical protein D3C59_29150 [Streptomyces sp. SHP22-7]
MDVKDFRTLAGVGENHGPSRAAHHVAADQDTTARRRADRYRPGGSGARLHLPSCGHHVPAEVTRHKTLGIYVPVWRRGTCHNPDCSAAGPERQR